MSITIVVPAYNEQTRISANMLALNSWCAKHWRYYEVLVVDDGSTDHTRQLAREAGCNVLHVSHRGKGAALTSGILAAKHEIVLLLDADLPCPLNHMLPLISEVMVNQSDIAIGSRGLDRPDAPAWRKMMAIGMVAARKLIVPRLGRFTDTQCGVKVVRKSVGIQLINNMVVYRYDQLGTVQKPSVQAGWDVEFLYLAALLDYRIREMPIEWLHQPTNRVSLRDGIDAIQDLLLIRAADMAGRYHHHPVIA